MDKIERCEAITKKGHQCSFKYRFSVPNHANEKLKPALLCWQHYFVFDKHKLLKLIKNCFLQPGNKYGYGNVIASEIINYKNPKKMYTVPSHYGNGKDK